ncbi:MAG: hypothetical protein MZV64_59655 [Ignavibacteriales bacterium]|nr:hypothetical protein [Ignavibacteriales bacterium]
MSVVILAWYGMRFLQREQGYARTKDQPGQLDPAALRSPAGFFGALPAGGALRLGASLCHCHPAGDLGLCPAAGRLGSR